MTQINATNQPIFWAVGDPVIASGVTEVGSTTLTGLTMISDTGETAFLGKVVGKATGFNPLPDSGTIEAGIIYGYNGGLVICRQTHERTIYAPSETPALFTVYRANAGLLEWIAGEKVLKGMQRTYGGKTYDVIQDHVTQVDWTPDKAITLWSEVIETPPTGAWAAGVAYKVGDVVTYNGKTYQCLQAHTSISTWMPSAVPALWKLL